MTTSARKAIADCHVALAELEAGPSGAVWRVRLFGTLALLRAVGHILENVDVDQSDAMRTAIDAAWQHWGANKGYHQIFWKFIYDDRYFLLKEYYFWDAQGGTINVPTAVVKTNAETGRHEQVGLEDDGSVDDSLIMTKGPFEGRTPTDLLRDAIAWWEDRLDKIDADAAR